MDLEDCPALAGGREADKKELLRVGIGLPVFLTGRRSRARRGPGVVLDGDVGAAVGPVADRLLRLCQSLGLGLGRSEARARTPGRTCEGRLCRAAARAGGVRHPGRPERALRVVVASWVDVRRRVADSVAVPPRRRATGASAATAVVAAGGGQCCLNPATETRPRPRPPAPAGGAVKGLSRAPPRYDHDRGDRH